MKNLLFAILFSYAAVGAILPNVARSDDMSTIGYAAAYCSVVAVVNNEGDGPLEEFRTIGLEAVGKTQFVEMIEEQARRWIKQTAKQRESGYSLCVRFLKTIMETSRS